MKKLKDLKINKLQAVLLVFLAIQLILLAVINLTLIGKQIDCDNAKCLTHIVKMWEHKRLAIPHWYYSTTLEWDCSSIFAIPFYGITHNIYIAAGLSNIVLTFIFLYAIWFLFMEKKPEYFLFAANITLIPYGLGMLDYYNMMFFGVSQYVVKVTTVILLAGILRYFDDADRTPAKYKNVTAIVTTVLYALFLLCTSMSSGLYFAITGFVPVLAGYVLYKLLKWEHVSVKNIILLAASPVVAVLGNLVNLKVLGENRTADMEFCSIYDIEINLRSNFYGLFELMGGLTKAPSANIMTPEGLAAAIKTLFTIILMVLAVVILMKMFKKELSLESSMMIIPFFYNWFIMLFVITKAGSFTTEYRYYLMGVVPLLIAVAAHVAGVIESDGNTARGFWGGLCITAFLVVMAALSYRAVLTAPETQQDLKELAAYCKNLDPDIIYMYDTSNESDMMKVFDPSKHYICLMDNGQTMAYDFYDNYAFGPIQTTDTMILINDSLFPTDDEAELLGMHISRVDTVTGWGIYNIK